jgi:carbon monoxide dehydrogenase subunit G
MRDLVPMELSELDHAPVRFTGDAVLAATPEAVFDELADPSLWLPLMRRSVWRTGATSGVGAVRDVELALFGAFRERMLVWDRGERCAFTMIGTTSPLAARMAEDWRLVREDSGTRVSYTVAAALRPFARPAAPALRIVMRQLFGAGVRALAKRTRWSAGRVRGTQPA